MSISYKSLSQESFSRKGEKLIEELSRFSPCKDLIEEAQQVIKKLGLAALEVRFETPKGGFTAEQEGNIIRIRPDLHASEQRGSLIFELTNIIQHEEAQKTDRVCREGGYKSAEEFARAVELIEYQGLTRCMSITRAVNKQKGRLCKPYMECGWGGSPLNTWDLTFIISYFSMMLIKNFIAKDGGNSTNTLPLIVPQNGL